MSTYFLWDNDKIDLYSISKSIVYERYLRPYRHEYFYHTEKSCEAIYGFAEESSL